MIIVKFDMPVKPKNRNELLYILRNISEDVKKEEGCIDNFIYQNLDDENDLIMIEAWKSKSSLKKHWKSAQFSALLGTKNLLINDPKVEINNVTETKGIEEIEKARAGNVEKTSGKGMMILDNKLPSILD